MAANSATGDLTPDEAKPASHPDRPLAPANTLTPRLWRVVSRDGSTCDLHLATGPQALQEDTTAQQHEGDVVCRDGEPDERWFEPKASLSDLAFEEAAAKSRQRVAGLSPASAKPDPGLSPSKAAPKLPENGESVEQSAPPALPPRNVNLSEPPAPMVLKPGALDPDLCHLIRRWLVLPPRVREAIVALIDAVQT